MHIRPLKPTSFISTLDLPALDSAPICCKRSVVLHIFVQLIIEFGQYQELVQIMAVYLVCVGLVWELIRFCLFGNASLECALYRKSCKIVSTLFVTVVRKNRRF